MGNKIHLACWRGDVKSLEYYTNNEWCTPQYRKPGVFGVYAVHIIVYKQYTNMALWYNLFYHMNGCEDLDVTFGEGVTAKDLAMSLSGPVVAGLLEMSSMLLRGRHFFRLAQEEMEDINGLRLPMNFDTVVRKGLSNYLLPTLEPHNIHSTLYPGAPRFFTPLFVAVLANDLPFLKVLISKGAQTSLQPPASEGNYGLLHLAAYLDHHHLIPTLVKAGCPIDEDAYPFRSRTPLVIAAHFGNLQSINVLANCTGFDLHSSKGASALFAAAQEGQFHVIPTLIKLGCKVDDSPYSNFIAPLHAAAKGDHVGVVSTLLKFGANAQSITSRGETALHLAAEHGSSDVISTLIKAGLSPYQLQDKDNVFLNPFFKAILRRSLGVLKELIKLGYTPDHHSGFGLLHIAVKIRWHLNQPETTRSMPHGIKNKISIRFLEELIKLGCNVSNIDSESGFLPIHLAAYTNDPAAIQLFINHGCPQNAFTRLPEGQRLTPMQVAARENSAKAIDILAANGCNVDFHHPLEDSALHIAISHGSLKAAKALLTLRASVTLRSQSGLLPMHTAIVHNQIEVIEMLFNHGASVCPGQDESSFIEEIVSSQKNKFRSEIDEVLSHFDSTISSAVLPYSKISSPAEMAAKLILQRIQRVEFPSFATPLMIAVSCKNQAATRKLVELGANINSTVLELAIALGNAKMAELLIDLGAVKDAVFSTGLRPIHTAIQHDHPHVVQSLMDKGCDPTMQTAPRGKSDLSPFQLASLLCRPKILQILYKFTPNVNQISYDHLSPLHLAILQASTCHQFLDGSTRQIVVKVDDSCREETVKLLLEYGCNVNATDEEGLTPLDLAVHYELETIVMILTQAGGERGEKFMDREELRKRVKYLEGKLSSLHEKVNMMEARIHVLETHQMASPSLQETCPKLFNADMDVHSSKCMCACACVRVCVCVFGVTGINTDTSSCICIQPSRECIIMS